MEAEVNFEFEPLDIHQGKKTFQAQIVQYLFDCLCSHKSSSIQKETPKKKPKLEMKPSNGDRYNKCCDCYGKHKVSHLFCLLQALSSPPTVVPSPSRWILEEQTTSSLSAS